MPRKTRATRPAALIAATLSGHAAGDALEQVIARLREGDFGPSELQPVCSYLWPIRDKLLSGEAVDRDDVHRLGLLVQHLPQIRQIAAEVIDFDSPQTSGSGAELVNYGLFIKTLPEVILDAGKQLGVDMTPVDRFVRALDNEPTDEETTCMMVDVKVCWDQCEVSLRDGRSLAKIQETFDQTAWNESQMLASGSPPVLAPTQPQTAIVPRVSNRYLFKMVKRHWVVQFGTSPQNQFTHLDGFLYLSVLLRNPGDGFTALELQAVKNRFTDDQESRSVRPLAEVLEARGDEGMGDNAIASKDAGELIDPEARKAYRTRIEEIAEELDEVRATHDEAAISKLEEEAAAIQDQLKAATGLGGRSVRQSTDRKKAQDKVRNAIDRAIDSIKMKDDPLARHLGRTVISRPSFKYDPKQDETLTEKPHWDG